MDIGRNFTFYISKSLKHQISINVQLISNYFYNTSINIMNYIYPVRLYSSTIVGCRRLLESAQLMDDGILLRLTHLFAFPCVHLFWLNCARTVAAATRATRRRWNTSRCVAVQCTCSLTRCEIFFLLPLVA